MAKRIMTIYGTRPEAIKVAPVVKALEAHPDFESLTVVTGQHREMLDQVNSIFDITPDHDLDVFAHGQPLNILMSKVFQGLDPILYAESPDAVVVQGDTSTVAAASVAAFYRQIPIFHLEAGLRSGNINSPFPEEANRKLTTQVTSLHLAPTATAKANLVAEGVDPGAIAITGNTVVDALLHTVQQRVPFGDQRLADLEQARRPVLLVTTHRRENWGDAMEGVGRALKRIATSYPDFAIVLPAHRNPIVRAAVLPYIDGLDNVLVTEPLPYGEFTKLMAMSTIILTDSGGVQEEAPSLGKPVLVMRENTERPEAVEAGTVRLIGLNENTITAEVGRLIDDPEHHAAMSNAVNPYGDGAATARSVAAVSQFFKMGRRMSDFNPS